MTRRDDAVYLSLRMEPESTEFHSFIKGISEEIWDVLPGKSKYPTKSHVEACGSLFADLIKVFADKPGRYGYRSMARDRFSGSRIGYRSLKQVVDGAIKLGFIEKQKGSGELEGVATRLRATPALIDIAKDHGIDLPDWRTHVRSLPRPNTIAEPLVLRRSSRISKGRKIQGEVMPFNPDQRIPKALAKQVNDLNKFFASVVIEPHDCHYAFQRVFNQGEIPDAKWKKGGRLISMGNSYQQMSGVERGAITLNGEGVVEIDIRSSQLRILYAKLGKEIDPTRHDPYYHPDIPREVIKTWVTMTLGYDRFQTRWSSDAVKDYLERHGSRLGVDFPIKKVRDAVLKMHPVLGDWESSPIRWGDLHYIESCIIVDTVHELAMQHGVPALPVHDSIIVPKSQEEIAKGILTANFNRHVGSEPVLAVK